MVIFLPIPFFLLLLLGLRQPVALIPNNVNWIITKVISFYRSRSIYLDIERGDISDSELDKNSFIIKDGLAEYLRSQQLASIEVYQDINHFPVAITTELLKQVKIGGKFMIIDTEENRNYLKEMNKEMMTTNFKVSKEHSNISPMHQALQRAKAEIKARLNDDDSQHFLKFLSMNVIFFFYSDSNSPEVLVFEKIKSQNNEQTELMQLLFDGSDDDGEDSQEDESRKRKPVKDQSKKRKAKIAKGNKLQKQTKEKSPSSAENGKLQEDENIHEYHSETDEDDKADKHQKNEMSDEDDHKPQKYPHEDHKGHKRQKNEMYERIVIDLSGDQWNTWNHYANQVPKGPLLESLGVQPSAHDSYEVVLFNQKNNSFVRVQKVFFFLILF